MRFVRTALCTAIVTLAGPASALPSADSLQSAFDQLDHNRDQQIGLVEWDQNAFALFRAADLNRNESLEAAEIAEGPGQSDAFAKFDANQNEQLELDEFMQLRRMLLRVADINGNDSINRVEFDLFQLLSEAGWEDEDQNGRINFAELRISMAKVFALADTDQDGSLSPAEANFLSPVSYAAATAQGPLTSGKLHVYYRRLLTGE
ncbi:MAG: EF-hand domain-containing protein [Opitutaceae bacterium]